MSFQYKFLPTIPLLNAPTNTVLRIAPDDTSASVPMSVENADFLRFLIDWKASAEVLNADGSAASYADWIAAGNPAAPD